MASSENLASIVDPWALRNTFQDSWISDSFSRETETLTRALQRSLAGAGVGTGTNSDAFVSNAMAMTMTMTPFLDLIKPESAPTPTVSGVSGGSETEPAPKRQRNAIPTAGGKVSKRKSRASKKNHTTFITADPANFRQMVQQVTGVRFGNSQVQMAPILKPEPQRPGSRLTVGGGGLPTLDTSAFLLNHHQQQVVGQSSTTTGSGSEITGPGPLAFGPGIGIANGGPIGSDFETFSTFPTLESWKVM